MAQQGRVFPLAAQGRDGTRWAYRSRVGARGSRRLQRGGFESEQAAAEALEHVLEQSRREQRLVESPTLSRVRRPLSRTARGRARDDREAALAAREGGARLRRAATQRASLRGDRSLADDETIPPGHRFEATQALRQVLARAVGCGLLDVNPAKLGVENPQRRYTEKRPFDSWDELYALARRLGARYGPMVLVATATGLRPGNWLALEHQDIDREAQVVYVRRTFRYGRIKVPKTKASVRAVPLQAIALAALDELPPNPDRPLVFPSVRGGHLDLHNFRNRNWKPAQKTAGITPLRHVYDLRHTFATFALRAGISTFDLSRYMGTSPAMIDRQHGHLARDGREHAIKLLDTYRAPGPFDVHGVDAGSVERVIRRQL
jgi:integrase